MSSSLKYIIFGSVLSLALTHVPQKEMTGSGIVKPDTLKQAEPDNTKVSVDTMAEDIDDIRYGKAYVSAPEDEVPSFQPVIFNFAIALIVVAAFLQLMNLFFFKKDIAWVVFMLIVAGFAASVLSSRIIYLQTTGLTERAVQVLQFHDLWAQWTLRSAFAALILQIVYLGITKFDKLSRVAHNTSAAYQRRMRLIMLVIAAVMLVSAYSVLRVGHFGSQLVDILHQSTPAFMNI